MKKSVYAFWGAAFTSAAVILFHPACTPTQKAIVKTALDETQIACVLANADLPNSTEVAAACAIDAVLIPVLEHIIDDFKTKRAAFAATQAAKACPPPATPAKAK